MSLTFEELDFQQTPLGEISLRRRAEPRLAGEILYEVKLGDEFLMSSLFTEAEIQLATLALAALQGADFDIVVGGLGLGYTAAAVLENSSVRSLQVIDVMQAVIDWHQNGMVPLGKQLTADPRCSLINGDFFDLASSNNVSFDPAKPDQKVHAILLDIDHSPSHWLNPGNQSFYTSSGMEKLTNKLLPGGIFGLWSNDPPDKLFGALLNDVFATAEAHIVHFPNPYTRGQSSNTVYLARNH